MKYHPDKHHRKSMRLKDYDYSTAGPYFVTICVQNRECLFGEICDKIMLLNTFGKIVDYQWKQIPTHFKNAKLDEFVVMPNHFHGIIFITGNGDGGGVGAKHSKASILENIKTVEKNASPLQQAHPQPNIRPNGTKPGSLSAMIQNFSSVTTRKINRIRKTPGAKLWQRNYWDRIIRNEKELFNTREYIINNPLKWELDQDNPTNWKTGKSSSERP